MEYYYVPCANLLSINESLLVVWYGRGVNSGPPVQELLYTGPMIIMSYWEREG